MPTKLVEYVINQVREKFLDGAEEFTIGEVYNIADSAADDYPKHESSIARHAVMRRRLQDERRKKGLIFVSPGVYRYPMTAGEHNAAIERGDKTYHGKPCKQCGGTLRYTKGGGCRACVIAAASGRYKPVDTVKLKKKVRADFDRANKPFAPRKATRRYGAIERLQSESDSDYFERIFKSQVRGSRGKRPTR